MGLRDILKKTRSGQRLSAVDAERQREISEMFDKTREKCRLHHGDPFQEYRTREQLPMQYEYGMNCFLDVTFETSAGSRPSHL